MLNFKKVKNIFDNMHFVCLFVCLFVLLFVLFLFWFGLGKV